MTLRNDLKAAVVQLLVDHVPETKALAYFPAVEPEAEQLALVEVPTEQVTQVNLGQAQYEYLVVIHLTWFTSDPDVVTADWEDFLDSVVHQCLAHRAKPGQPALHGLLTDFARSIKVIQDPPLQDSDIRIFSAHIEVSAHGHAQLPA